MNSKWKWEQITTELSLDEGVIHTEEQIHTPVIHTSALKHDWLATNNN